MPGRDDVLGHPALTDDATGLANRLQFDLVYRYLFHGADRGVPLTVMLVSVASREPAVLTGTGEVIQRVTRSSDLVAHVEPGRFAILLLGTNLPGARIAADRLEEALALVVERTPAIALASYAPGEMDQPHELLEAAERALRAAEARGGGLEMI
jgi:GGDEF domain-containing protein